MSNERGILCGDADWPAQCQGLKEPLRLQLFGSQRNVDLRIQDISKSFAANISDIFIDLMEIATYVYCADQAVTRGGKTDRGMGANWRRHLMFHIPVRRPDVWNSPAISECLSRTLSFLSDDFYSFTFARLKNPPPSEKYLEGLGDPNLQPEEVVLYSGGLDSLAGAVQEAVIEKKRAILVSHRASPKIHTKQRTLLNELLVRLGESPFPTYIPVWITKQGAWGGEYTQRTRSFLYAALGATMAHLFDLPRIRMFENGIISLNLPISAQLIGARASRTTHPQVLKGFGELISLITEKPFQVENPFLWKTRAEAVRLLGDAGYADLIRFSVSCSHVREMTILYSHCGKCSQCIDRRFAVLASGYGEHEPLEMYKVDLLTGTRETLEDRTMLESYVRTATQVTKMTEVEFFSHFGEASRIFSHLEGTADENAAKIWDLHKRHAGQICEVIDTAIQNHVREIREGTLPESSLLILALPEKYRSSGELVSAESEKARYAFRKRGDFWEIIFEGKEVPPLKDEKGMHYIAYLLRHPNQEFHVLRLVQEVEGTPPIEKAEIYQKMDKEQLAGEGLSILGLGDGGGVIDAEARAEYSRQIRELQKEIEEAEENNDFTRADGARSKKESLEEHLLAASGLLGRTRKFYNSDERARISVRNRITASRKKIQEEHPELGQHLRNFIKTGFSCSYTPDKPTPWET